MRTFAACLLLLAFFTLSGYASFPLTREVCREADLGNPCNLQWILSTASDGASLGTQLGAAVAHDLSVIYDEMDIATMEQVYTRNPAFKAYVDAYLAQHQQMFPTESAEAAAFAQAARMPLTTFFMSNVQSEIMWDWPDLYNYPDGGNSSTTWDYSSATSTSAHCSDVGLSQDGHLFLGHNEDWDPYVSPIMRMVRTPNWIGYVYPGWFAGTSFTANRWGVAITMNALYPSGPGFRFANGMPAWGISYVLRSIISAKSVAEIIDTLRRLPTYHGFSLNVLDTCAGTVSNIEGWGDRISVQTRTTAFDGSFVHFNRYLNLNVPQTDDAGFDSGIRLEAAQAVQFHNLSDISLFLRDAQPPVFHTFSNTDSYESTMATFLIDPQAHMVTVYRLPAGCKQLLSDTHPHTHSHSSRCAKLDPELYQQVSWAFMCPLATA